MKAYTAFNYQDLQILLSLVDRDVNWPNGEKRLDDKPAVEEYWSKQWSEVHPHDEPVAFRDLSERTTVVHICQAVFDLKGTALSKGEFEHTYITKRIDFADEYSKALKELKTRL